MMTSSIFENYFDFQKTLAHNQKLSKFEVIWISTWRNYKRFMILKFQGIVVQNTPS